MREKIQKHQNKTKTIRGYPPPVPYSHPNKTQQPPPIPSPIICNNNTMNMVFLVQMRQSNKCKSVRNDEIINLHLGSGAAPWVCMPCLLQDTRHIYWFHPPKQSTRKKQRIQKLDLTFKQIISYCLSLCTQNSRLRAVDFEPSPKRGSDKIKVLK